MWRSTTYIISATGMIQQMSASMSHTMIIRSGVMYDKSRAMSFVFVIGLLKLLISAEFLKCLFIFILISYEKVCIRETGVSSETFFITRYFRHYGKYERNIIVVRVDLIFHATNGRNTFLVFGTFVVLWLWPF